MTIKSSFYLDMWRKAFAEPQSIPCENHKEANAIRLRMYVAARPYRSLESSTKRGRDGKEYEVKSKAFDDYDLYTKLQSLEAVVRDHEDGSATLLVRPEWLNERLMKLSAATGIPLRPYDVARESMKRIQDRLESDEVIDEPIALPVQPVSYLELKKQNSHLNKTTEAIESTEPEYVPLGDDYERKVLEALEGTGDLYAEE